MDDKNLKKIAGFIGKNMEEMVSWSIPEFMSYICTVIDLYSMVSGIDMMDMAEVICKTIQERGGSFLSIPQ